MAKPTEKITLGIDVAKDQVVIHHWQLDKSIALDNQPEPLRDWFRTLCGPVRLAVEPTSHYHLPVVEAALAEGFDIYLVNPRQLVHYRQAVNVRNKTDPQDAWLLARYLEHEAAQLRPFRPQSRQAQQLWALITRRAAVVQSRQQMQQSFAEVSLSIEGLLTKFQELLRRIDRQILRLLRELGWEADYQRCRSIPGIGAGNAAALAVSYHRGAFGGSDAFVAYLGLDIRLRESGRYKGQAKLTKQGAPELRRLLYCASHPARSHPRFAEYYQRQLDKGMSKIAARVALARKLARIAFTLMSRQETFQTGDKNYCMGP